MVCLIKISLGGSVLPKYNFWKFIRLKLDKQKKRGENSFLINEFG